MKSEAKKAILILLILLLLSAVSVFCYFFVGTPRKADSIRWGVNFSQKFSQQMGLDWKRTYIALLYDLEVKDIKIAADWDMLEPEEGKYDFSDLDWQIGEAEKKGVKIILAIGMKTPRWPECHIPEWAESSSDKQQKIQDLIKQIILRYKNSSSIWAWQVENEPFFKFGICPQREESFLKDEIAIVRSLDDKNRPIIISDTGEMSLWWKAGELGDLVGITMYKKVHSKEINMYFNLPYPPVFYWRKAQLVKAIFKKDVICAELQAEPWTSSVLYAAPLSDQMKAMDLNQFDRNIKFAQDTGLDTFYFWGAEWWYWMKENNSQPEYWNKAKDLFK